MHRYLFLLSLTAAAVTAQQAAPPCAGLSPGKHSLLERFTALFSLTCEQQLKVEPLLHAEESVSKPLLAFAAFTAEERQAVMLRIKVAARRQVKGVLAPEQRKLMDAEIESVQKSGSKAGGGKKGGAKKTSEVDPFANEEALCRAIGDYRALTSAEKTAMIREVKRAAIREGGLNLSPEQRRKVAADLERMAAR